MPRPLRLRNPHSPRKRIRIPSRQPPSPCMAAPLCRGPLLVLNADLAWLEPRLARRLDLMLAAGALEEAQKARVLCDDPAAPGGLRYAGTILAAKGKGRRWFRG